MFDWRSTENSPSPLKNKEIHIPILKGTNAVDLDAGASSTRWNRDYLRCRSRVAFLIVLPSQKLPDVPPSCHIPSSIFFPSVSLKTRVQRETRCLERGSRSLSGHRCILCRRMSLMATLSILSFRCWMQMSARRLRDAKRGDKWRHSFTNSCCFSMCSSASRHQPSVPHMSHTDRVYIIHHIHI